MTTEERDIQRKLKMWSNMGLEVRLRRENMPVFGVGRSSFFRWNAAYEPYGEAGQINEKPIPKNLASPAPPQAERASEHSKSMPNIHKPARLTSSITSI